MAPGARLAVRVLLGGMAPWQSEVLGDLLAADAAFAVVGVAADAKETIAQAAALAPHVVLLNFRDYGGGALEMVRRLCAAAPRSRVLLLGDSDASEAEVYRTAAPCAGASAYVSWLSSRADLLAAVHATVPERTQDTTRNART